MVTNGRLPLNKLVEVEPGQYLEIGTAIAYRSAKQTALSQGIDFRMAGSALHYINGMTPNPCASGAYRPYAMQADMHIHPASYGLDNDSSIPVANAGESTHGDGTRFDLITPARAWAQAHLPAMGFVWEFKQKDPGHWKWPFPTFASISIQSIIETEDDNMPVFMTDGQNIRVIYWENGWNASYDYDVFAACYAVAKGGDTEPSRVQTFIREAWAASDGMTARNAAANAAAVKAALKASGILASGNINPDDIAKAVIAGLPTYTLTRS